VQSVSGVAVYNYSTTVPAATFDFCNLSVIITHPGDDDIVYVSIWLPLDSWNGRYQSTGGGGLQAGYFDPVLGPAVALGYSAGSTDGGLTLNKTINPQTGIWGLKADGSRNLGLLENFSYRAIHDMTAIGKAATRAFYGMPSKYSYYTGCSTGGRQGYFEAQLFPEDFDGILANAPAVNGPNITPALFWPVVVMANTVVPPQCIFTAYLSAIIATCDSLDGAVDGIISDPDNCKFDPTTLIGSKVNCSGQDVTISAADASVVTKMLQGPRTTTGEQLWSGLPPGAPFSGQANTTLINGTLTPVPFVSAESAIRYIVMQDPNYDTMHMSYAAFDEATSLSVTSSVVGLDTDRQPDLTKFKKRGGKLLTWHGLADQLLTPASTLLYRERLEQAMGGTAAVNEFYRLFFAPGVYHCSGGPGPIPVDALGALVKWVESGVAPDILPATSTSKTTPVINRNLCHYPQTLKYTGSGDVHVASSFTCV
jgi:feruloyl esterase